MARPKISFLILSDIHFGGLAEHRDFALPGTQLAGEMDYGVSMKANLIATVKSINTKIDMILVPGDLTSAACPSEFQACCKLIAELADQLHVPRDNVFYTYGNHDCNWRISRLADGDETFGIDELYRVIASSVGEYFCPLPPSAERGPLPGSGVVRLAGVELIIANTGYFSSHDQSLKHGRLGPEQLAWLKEVLRRPGAADCWRILMLHHHSYGYPYPIPVHDLSFVEEGDTLVQLLGASGVDFVCHGHRHHPFLNTRIEAGWASPITFFCAGSVAVNAKHRSSGHIPNLFHVVTLEGKHPTSQSALGSVRTFRFAIPHGWVPNTEYTETVPLDAIHHFGSVISHHERRALISDVVRSVLSDSGEKFVRLPGWGELPVDLRYATLQSTNAALTEAVEAAGGELYERYPRNPIVVRPSHEQAV